jgi:hypothetical protein
MKTETESRIAVLKMKYRGISEKLGQLPSRAGHISQSSGKPCDCNMCHNARYWLGRQQEVRDELGALNA